MINRDITFVAASLVSLAASPVLALADFVVCAQSVTATAFNTSVCLPGSGVTAFDSCERLTSTISECLSSGSAAAVSGVSAEDAAARACECNQDVFNLIFG
jgi:hypothetical protein